MNNSIKIIAESASNHNGDFDDLINLAKLSKLAKADYFTCQVCDANSFCDNTYPSFDVVKQITYSSKQWLKFFQISKDEGIKLIPCPTDEKSLNICLEQGFNLIKIHGTDILSVPILETLAAAKKKIILETQFATEKDIDFAISILGNDNIECLIHGYSNYPTEGSEHNLNALDFMKSKWNHEIGYADHSLDIAVIPMMAISKGATWIEKHLTLSRNSRNFDWQTSLEYEDFLSMVLQIQKYKLVLGKSIKHPTKNETNIRKIAFKKYLKEGSKIKLLRSLNGQTFHEYYYSTFNPKNIIVSVCGRLGSTRLKKKLLLKFHEDKLIFDIFSLIEKSKMTKSSFLATSKETSDDQLVEEAHKRKINVFRGDGKNLVHRLISLAEEQKASAIIKITGDSPFAVPEIIDEMCEMFLKYDLDYVRSMNLPQGVSPELFSTKYLQRLYQEMEDPTESEYLGYFVVLDKNAKKGCVHVKYENLDFTKYKLSIDLQEDMIISKNLLSKINKKEFSQLNLKDILSNVSSLETIPKDTVVKMPNDTTINYYDYVQLLWDQGYSKTKILQIV